VDAGFDPVDNRMMDFGDGGPDSDQRVLFNPGRLRLPVWAFLEVGRLRQLLVEERGRGERLDLSKHPGLQQRMNKELIVQNVPFLAIDDETPLHYFKPFSCRIRDLLPLSFYLSHDTFSLPEEMQGDVAPQAEKLMPGWGQADSSRIWDGPLYRDSGKVIEKSKEGFRQFLLKHFPDPDVFTNKDRMKERSALAKDTALPASALMDVSKTYTDIAEKITGKALATSRNPRAEIIEVLDKQFGLIATSAPLVVIAAGSDSDMPHLETLKKELWKFSIKSEIRICSAHKQPGRLEAVLAEYGKTTGPVMMVGCAGGTDALSGTASYLANFPVVSCPPDGLNDTCLTNPPGSSNAFICKPANVAKFAAQYLARYDKAISDALDANITEKITKLETADTKLTGKVFEKPARTFPTSRTLVTGSPLVVIAAGSDSDMSHLESLEKELAKFKIRSEIRICSAHKQPGRLESVIADCNKFPGPIMLVGCAGGTDALSGTASYLAKFPVVSCPPDGMNKSCLTNPPGSSNAYILKPANVAKFAAQMFSRSSEDVADALRANIGEKVTKLEKADEQLAKRPKLFERALC